MAEHLLDLLYTSMTTPLAGCNTLFYQSLPTSIYCQHAIAGRRKDESCGSLASRGVVARLRRVPSGVWSPGGPPLRFRRALCAPRQLTPYCHTSGLELEGMFQRSTALPDVERQRGTQHGGKAESEEKVLKSSFRKTCMVRWKLNCFKPSSKLGLTTPRRQSALRRRSPCARHDRGREPSRGGYTQPSGGEQGVTNPLHGTKRPPNPC